MVISCEANVSYYSDKEYKIVFYETVLDFHFAPTFYLKHKYLKD